MSIDLFDHLMAGQLFEPVQSPRGDSTPTLVRGELGEQINRSTGEQEG
jgi:hypothetical protein